MYSFSDIGFFIIASSARPKLIIAVLGYVAYPRKGLVTGLFNDFQIPNLNA